MSLISGITSQALAAPSRAVEFSKLLPPLQPPATAKKIAQATGSELLSAAQVQRLNPAWKGQSNVTGKQSADRISATTRDLQRAGFLVDKTVDSDQVKQPIVLGKGISIPVGSIASGEGTEKVIFNVYRSAVDLTFRLPNGSELSFSASSRSRGGTDIAVTDKAGKTTTSTVDASLLFDITSQSLRFISNAGNGKFRVADLRSQLGNSNQQLLAALQNIGVASQR